MLKNLAKTDKNMLTMSKIQSKVLKTAQDFEKT